MSQNYSTHSWFLFKLLFITRHQTIFLFRSARECHQFVFCFNMTRRRKLILLKKQKFAFIESVVVQSNEFLKKWYVSMQLYVLLSKIFSNVAQGYRPINIIYSNIRRTLLNFVVKRVCDAAPAPTRTDLQRQLLIQFWSIVCFNKYLYVSFLLFLF